MSWNYRDKHEGHMAAQRRGGARQGERSVSQMVILGSEEPVDVINSILKGTT